MKIKIFLLAFITMGMLYSCNKKDNFNYPEGTVGSSTITYFPIVSLKGERYMAVEKGGAFVDPGAIAKEAGTDVPYTTEGTVDVNTVGVYNIVYTAVNKDGFSASVTRTVAVYFTEESAALNDLSGKYLRAATNAIATWTKLAPGVYLVDNPGGAAGVNLQAITFNSSDFNIHIPTQITNDGNTTSSNSEVYVNGNPASYSLKIANPGYGTGVRSFVKQ